MDNYKIKVKDEAESKEAQELFFDLGYEWKDSKRDITNLDATHIYADDGVLTFGFNDFNFRGSDNEELTLPQLRDLVVLKRNDINDANCIDKKREAWYLASDGTYYAWQYRKLCWDTESDACVEAHDIKPITKPQDPALISGDVALANVHKCIVQYLHDDEPYGRWTTITDHFWSQYHLGMFLDPDTKFKFRFKPQTIKLELELPKPFEPEEDCHVYILDDGKTDGYRRYSYEVHGDKGNTFIGIWRTEDEIKQVVEQLRKIRGTNS
ncbi:hypothetical protein F4T81_19945 [Acinetobacter nosocomialis]|uniref:hypothetical protein n=1 Tax=Acinetobacter nosocomialis TaxID=106654 RepID=UPI001298725F|nr:hypothetical protein [Acinetobacter nosocomialis]MRA12801.1 hypothetical protein [Acinetobacter nosocomialis]